MDAAGSERAAIIGVADSGPMAMLFAATYPERVSSLTLINTGPRFVRSAEYPWGLTSEQVDEFLSRTRETWGTGGIVERSRPDPRGTSATRSGGRSTSA